MEDDDISDYEKARLARIARNQAMLASLGLGNNTPAAMQREEDERREKQKEERRKAAKEKKRLAASSRASRGPSRRSSRIARTPKVVYKEPNDRVVSSDGEEIEEDPPEEDDDEEDASDVEEDLSSDDEGIIQSDAQSLAGGFDSNEEASPAPSPAPQEFVSDGDPDDDDEDRSDSDDLPPPTTTPRIADRAELLQYEPVAMARLGGASLPHLDLAKRIATSPPPSAISRPKLPASGSSGSSGSSSSGGGGGGGGSGGGGSSKRLRAPAMRLSSFKSIRDDLIAAGEDEGFAWRRKMRRKKKVRWTPDTASSTAHLMTQPI